jgi:hypothetical protein
MPGIFIFGVSADTPQKVLVNMEAAVKEATHNALGCPEDWVDVYPIPDLLAKRHNVWVLAGTGVFETKARAESEKMAHNLTSLLCPVIHKALGLGDDRKVEAFPLPLALHLHSIFPPSS